MKKITEDFLEDVIKRNVHTSKVRDSKTGSMIEREIVDVKEIVREVMTALRTKKKAVVKKAKPKAKPKKKKVK